ncbi:RNA-binding protein 34 [Solea solea]|uniref:RNA-binding protein 34 n=1 Tax=Solea solea TaxID=90069 RepID=UPI00272D516E|nr:RNA-binding protein 34 [Solea solea]
MTTTKKKKLPLSEAAAAASSGQQSADYVVGQVSGSLFQKTSSASGSLSNLFGSAAPAAALLFQPVPETKSELKEQQDETPEVKGQPKKKQQREKRSEAEQKLDNRENALQNADEDEQDTSTKKKTATVRTKRTASESGVHNDTEHWVKKRQRTKSCKEEEAAKTKRTVFVGNLPTSCTKKTLRSLFRDKGNIESIRFRSVVREDPSMSRKVAAIKRQIHPKKPSVNAYVVFKDEGGVANALERNGVEIEKDFVIRVDRVTDSSSHDHKRSVFVGNLSFEISEVVFRRHFEPCGSVEAVRLVRDKNSGLGKGFGYVLFENADSVMLALELDGSAMDGRSIRVKRSVKKEKQKKTNSERGSAHGPMRGAGRGRGSAHGPMRGAGRGRGAMATPGRGSAHGPMRGTGRGRGVTAPPGRGRGFKSPQKLGRNQVSANGSASFRGQMVDPNKKMKKKERVKRKPKPNKAVHI